MSMTSYESEECEIQIRFSPEAVATLSKFRQTCSKTEAGGLLFTKNLESEIVEIECVTTPSKLDWRSRFGFRPNKRAAQNTINEKFKQGLHYVGDWHSHAQNSPRPSRKDRSTITDIFCKSTHGLNYLVMVILSSSQDFSKSYVALTNGKDIYRCKLKLHAR